jgi:hypothetical protein
MSGQPMPTFSSQDPAKQCNALLKASIFTIMVRGHWVGEQQKHGYNLCRP